MNEPIQHAQETTGRTTAKALLAVVKHGSDSLGLHGDAAPNRASYSDSFVFTVRGTKRDRKGNVETQQSVQAPGWVTNGHTSERNTRKGLDTRERVYYSETHRPGHGYWYLSLSPRERLIDILELLPSDAEVGFQVYLDAATNDYLVNAETMNGQSGLHGDILYLVATYTSRGKRVSRTYQIDVMVCPHNTARFGVRW